MWPLSLTTLAAVVAAVNCSCSQLMFEPLIKTMVKLNMSAPMSWQDAVFKCRKQFLGFEVLGRDFLTLTEADKALCKGHRVPLGLETQPALLPGSTDAIVWNNRFDKQGENVNSVVLALKDSNDERNDTFQGASVDPITNRWHPVDKMLSTFDCVICQRAWLKNAWSLRFEEENRCGMLDPVFAYTFYLVKIGNENFTVDQAINRITARFLENDVYVTIVPKVPNKSSSAEQRGVAVRLVSYGWDMLLDVKEISKILNGSYLVQGWWDMDNCPAMVSEGLYWNTTRRGSVSKVQLTSYVVAVKPCLEYIYENKDIDAIWDSKFYLYVDRQEECIKEGSKRITKTLQGVNGTSVEQLKYVVETSKTATEWPYLEGEFYSTRTIRSNEILSSLSSILKAAMVSNDTDGKALSTCIEKSCGLISTHRNYSMPPIYLGFTPEKIYLTSQNPDVENVNILLEIQQAGSVVLCTTAGGGNEKSIYFKGPFERTSLLSKYSPCNLGAVIHFLSEKTLEGQTTDGDYLTFRINNPDIDHIRRYFSVWELGLNEESTKSCPLISREGSVDTYKCAGEFASRPKSFTGTYLVLYDPKDLSVMVEYSELIEKVYRGYTSIAINKRVLQVVADLTAEVIDTDYTRWQNEKEFLELESFICIKDRKSIKQHLENIVSNVVLEDAAVVVSQRHVKFLVSDLTRNDPVIGISLGKPEDATAVQTILASTRHDIYGKSMVDIILGPQVDKHCQRLQLLILNDFEAMAFDTSLTEFIQKRLLDLQLAITASSDAELSDIYLDIQLPFVRDEKGIIIEDAMSQRVSVAAWNEDESDWIVAKCTKLRSTRNNKRAFRCNHPSFTGSKLRGRYLIFVPVSFSDYLNTKLIYILIVTGIISSISVMSIVVTAASLPSWRKDPSQQVLLQMTLALSLNLVLGFTSNLASQDMASITCVLIGALRHFSYLAMFAWTLIMSGLQLIRLLSVVGSRATRNLLLKTSLLAWGLPTVAVSATVPFYAESYLSDVADRGFCYPEGSLFLWTVQLPAATILMANATCFLVMLARLFGVFGWGETENLQRHRNERTFQLLRLRTVFFTFCVAGITWVFHLLAEQGLFQEKYIYEYLFLVTGAVHGFALSCIFVFFDKKTHEEWFKLIAPEKARAKARQRFVTKMQHSRTHNLPKQTSTLQCTSQV